MVNKELVAVMAKIAAVQARIEATKAANDSARWQGLAIVYGESEFVKLENRLKILAKEALDCQCHSCEVGFNDD